MPNMKTSTNLTKFFLEDSVSGRMEHIILPKSSTPQKVVSNKQVYYYYYYYYYYYDYDNRTIDISTMYKRPT